ncbi:MAG: hypothetical protein ACRELB_23290 [Polyangiaceae bacterium]
MRRQTLCDREGRRVTITLLRFGEAEDEDLRYWLEELTPQERLDAVEECMQDYLRLKGRRDLPRVRRVLRLSRQTRS